MQPVLRFMILAGMVAVVGCTPAPPADDDSVEPTGDDDSVGDDDTAASGCAERVLRDESLWIDGNGPDTQIHVNVAADSVGVWAAYNRPRDDGSGQFDVFVTHIDCDGETTVQPTRIHSADGANHVDPAVAVSGGRLLVVWHRDDSQYPFNLSVHRAVLEEDGTVVASGDALALTTDDGPYEGNAWMPAAAPLPGGGFAVAGVRGHEEYGSFQVFVQRLDANGASEGETLDAADDPDASHTSPALAASNAGEMNVAWTRSPIDGDDEVRFATIPDGAATAGPQTDLLDGSTTYSPALAWGESSVIAATEDLGGSAAIVLRATAEGAPPLELAEPGRFLHSPALAATGDGGAVAAYRLVSGLDNDLWLARWSRDVYVVEEVATEEIDVGTGAAPYAPALTHVVDDVWFVAWSEGDNPDYRVRGRFVDFGP